MRAIAERWAPWLAGAVLVAGIVAFGVTRLTGGGGSTIPHRRAPLVAAERQVALEFIHTAVARQDLARAWGIVAPELKQGMSLAEWTSGTIPVVPYPVAEARVVLHTTYSYTDVGRVDVTFLPHAGTTAVPASFTLDLSNVGGRWLVRAWLPSASVLPRQGK